MYLTHRMAQASDPEACFPFLQARIRYGDALREDVVALDRQWIESGACIAMVWEDRDRPGPRKAVAYALAFFATDWFVREAKSTLPPFLPVRVLERWKRGRRPFLDKAASLEAQAGKGLNVVLHHRGEDPSLGRTTTVNCWRP